MVEPVIPSLGNEIGIWSPAVGPTLGAEGGKGVSAAQTAERFGQALMRALEGIDQLQRQADAAALAYATGENRDVGALMIATERANLALQLAVQVRNKVLEAYQELVRMPL